MRDFIRKALTKLDKLDQKQIHSLIHNLAQDNVRYEGLIEASVDYLIVADLDHRVVIYNRNVERFLLASRSPGLHGRKMWSIIADKDLAAFVKETLETHEMAVNRDFTLDESGEARIMSVTLIPLSTRGKVYGELFYMTDVTLLRTQEARLRRAESLASLTTLAASVAHEIKNPLGAISIHIQLIRKALRGKSPANLRHISKNIDVVSEEVERLNKIVVDFLFAVRPMNIKPEKKDVNSLLREILDFIGAELAANKIKVEEKLTRRLPRILVDPKALRQAVLNITGNAILAMPNGGTLTIATGKKNDCVRIVISDTGVGIPAGDLDKIFEPFFTTRDVGSGLGLTNVLKIIKEHKADITVDSKPGKGAAFTISFPIPESETQLLEYEKTGENLE